MQRTPARTFDDVDATSRDERASPARWSRAVEVVRVAKHQVVRGGRVVIALFALIAGTLVAIGRSGASTAPTDGTLAAAALGQALGAAVPGVPSSFYGPAPTPTPQSPGQLVETAGDASDPFVYVQGSTYYL